MIPTRTVMKMLNVVAIATPLAALSPSPPAAPLAGEVVERFIACYPRIDAVRRITYRIFRTFRTDGFFID
jgi:hypothetical protein